MLVFSDWSEVEVKPGPDHTRFVYTVSSLKL